MPKILIAGGGGGRRCKLLKTGQTTQYSGENDDGLSEKGIAKLYTILTLGQYADTKNIDLAHLTSTHIAFVAGAPDTITSDTTNFTTLFVAGDVIPVSGAVNPANNAVHTIAAGGVAAGVLTLTSNNVLTNEVEGASVTIKKREAHSNNCVLDMNTGLLWSRYVAANMGTTSVGRMPWTGQLYDAFAYCAAANAAALAGYADWRIPNDVELLNLRDLEAPTAVPDAAAFPSWPAAALLVWASSTRPDLTTSAFAVGFGTGIVYYDAKTTALYYAALVRGG